MNFYKYAEQQYTDSLMSMGNLRVGTLHDFRRSEHKRGIGDGGEGKKVVNHRMVGVNEHNIKAEHALANELFKAVRIEEGATNVNIGQLIVEQHFDHPDCYILCLSHERSKAVMNSLEGTDSCLELVGFEPFLHKLTEVLNELVPVKFLGVDCVTYQSREEKWNGRDFGAHPAFVKEFEYKAQAEVRAIWEPKFNHPISPIIVNHIALSQYFKPIQI